MQHSDETIMLCTTLVSKTIERDRPNLASEPSMCALIRGVILMLNAGAHARDGVLLMPESPVAPANDRRPSLIASPR